MTMPSTATTLQSFASHDSDSYMTMEVHKVKYGKHVFCKGKVIQDRGWGTHCIFRE